MFTPITDHQLAAVARLIAQYKGKTTVEGTVSALVAPIQTIEDALVSLNQFRALETAVGVQLDLLGQIIGLARVANQSDDSYRQAIKAKIQANTSEGQPSAIVATFLLLTGVSKCLLDEFFPAALMIESTYVPTSQADANALIEIIDTVAAGGVRMEGIVSYDPDTAFSFDGDLSGSGFGDLADSFAGGYFSTLYTLGGDGVKEFSFDGNDPNGAGFGDTGDALVGGVFVSL